MARWWPAVFGSRRSFSLKAATEFNRDDQSVRMPSLSM
jgi:hypothetical protein